MKSCLNLVEALFVMRNADPFWQLIDSHKHLNGFECFIFCVTFYGHKIRARN